MFMYSLSVPLFVPSCHPSYNVSAVVPVAAATMTPIPLLLGLCVKKITEKFCYQDATTHENDPKVCGIIKGTTMTEKSEQPLDNLKYDENFKESESTQKLMINVESPLDEESPSRR